MCSEKWHTVVESSLRNVKLLEEKGFFYFYFLYLVYDFIIIKVCNRLWTEMPFLHVTKKK